MNAGPLRRAAAAAAIAALAVALPGGAVANGAPETPVRVLLAGPTTGAAAVIARVRAELAARGIEAETGAAFDPDQPIAPGLSAIVRLAAEHRRHGQQPDAWRVEIWTPDAATGSARIKAVLGNEPGDRDRDGGGGDGDGAQTLPVRIAEAVRAFVGQPVSASPPPWIAPASSPPSPPPAPSSPPAARSPTTSSSPPPVAVVVPAHPRRLPTLALGVDAALLAPGGGAGAGGAAILRARYLPAASSVGLGARIVLPVVPATARREGDSASIAATIATIEGYLRLLGSGPDSSWEAGVAAGVGVAWLRLSGVANPPLSARRDDVWTALPFGAAELGYRGLGPRLRLRASLLAGMAAPGVTIRFAGTPVSIWGDPLVAVALGVDVDL